MALRYELEGVGQLTEVVTFTGHDVAAVADRHDVAAALQLLHLTSQVEDDLDAGEVDAEVARQGENGLELLAGRVIVQPRVAARPGGLEQPLPLP